MITTFVEAHAQKNGAKVIISIPHITVVTPLEGFVRIYTDDGDYTDVSDDYEDIKDVLERGHYKIMSYQKFGNKPVVVNGIRFQSRLESERYEQLLLLERAGEISDLWLQVELQVNHGRIDPETGERIRSTNYVADFMYVDKAQHKIIIEDTKGMETPEFRLKWNLAKSLYPEYEFRKVTREDV